MRDRELSERYGFSKEFAANHRELVKEKTKDLTWNRFFEIKEGKTSGSGRAKYSAAELERMDGEALKQAVSEYWFQVYFELYGKQWKTSEEKLRSPEFLNYLGLPYDADGALIKKRFRELAKRLHPDAGGSDEEFRTLIEMSERYGEK